MGIDVKVIFLDNGMGFTPSPRWLMHLLDNGRVTVARARSMVAHAQ